MTTVVCRGAGDGEGSRVWVDEKSSLRRKGERRGKDRMRPTENKERRRQRKRRQRKRIKGTTTKISTRHAGY